MVLLFALLFWFKIKIGDLCNNLITLSSSGHIEMCLYELV